VRESNSVKTHLLRDEEECVLYLCACACVCMCVCVCVRERGIYIHCIVLYSFCGGASETK